MEQQQAVQLHSDFGIGIEREIYSKPYFSYHYGYKNLSQIPERKSNSKLFEIENKIKKKFKNINFHILFLNVSQKGTFVNFTLKDQSKYNEIKTLGIIPIRNQNSFSFNLDEEGEDIFHREIFPKPLLDQFPINDQTLEVIYKIKKDFDPMFECIGFDGCKGNLNYNDVHLEIYPENNLVATEDFINTLDKYNIDTKYFKKYFFNYKKFSHIKFKIESGTIKNIKYYRSINVNIPEFYYG